MPDSELIKNMLISGRQQYYGSYQRRNITISVTISFVRGGKNNKTDILRMRKKRKKKL
jgi:hypothetical protein